MSKVSVAKTNKKPHKLPALITVHRDIDQSNVHLVTCQIMTNNISFKRVKFIFRCAS